MNRSRALVGVALPLGGLVLVASPVALTGSELFTVERKGGNFGSPIHLLDAFHRAVRPHPERTASGGTFGNPTADREWSTQPRSVESLHPHAAFDPEEPVHCQYGRTMIGCFRAFRPRCDRARACRPCNGPIGVVENRTDGPGRHRAEALCDCARVARAYASVGTAGPRRRPA